MPKEPTNARKSFGDIALKFAEIIDKILFGEIWEDTTLTLRERSLVTNISLIGRGRDVSFLTPPAQIRTCGTTAYGSCLES